MESKEMDEPDKEPKDTAKESPTSQPYSLMPPHSYLASSHHPPPYIWGAQHLIPPYGTGRTAPLPYVVYPHGGLYGHPSMPPGSYPFNPYAMPPPNGCAEASANTPSNMEVNSNSPERKEKLPIKRSKGSLDSLNIFTGKNNESDKTGVSANRSYTKSGESGSEGSSEGSDASSENNSQMNSRSREDSMKGEASQNGDFIVNGHHNGGLVNQTVLTMPMSAAAAVPTTNLKTRRRYASVRSRRNPQPRFWQLDEKELKRQKRKQANREAAIRSRLRKQRIYDELAQRAETLKEENASLKTELSRIRSNYEQLLAENAALVSRQNAILERLGEAPGQEKIKQEPYY